MSHKYRVIQDGPNRFVLPRAGEMRCDVTAFLSPDLFAQTNEKMWLDAVVSASYPGATGMYLMPDCHQGYVLPVGGVLITEDTIVQAGSGYDIGCGIVCLQTPLHASDVVDWDKRKWWVNAVERHVATGLGSDRAVRQGGAPSRTRIEDIFRHGAAALGIQPDSCERVSIPVSDDFDSSLIGKATDKAGPQLGSVGSGNHYVELEVDRDDGSVWVMVHCGSRGFGWQAANYFFYEGSRLRGLPTNRREESWLRLDEPLGKLYWNWHNAAANFAVGNRWTLVAGVQAALGEVYDVQATPYYEISHNLVQQETLVLPDGTTKRGFVHRKGATRAFPAGHPDLVGTRWHATGHPCLIPGSMFDGAAILFPRDGAYRSGCSVNHGSGRVLGRGQAKRELTCLHDEIDQEMRTVSRRFGPEGVEVVGIVGNTDRTPLDECGHVYKDLDEVLHVLETEGIAKVEHRMYPVANIKGADS